MTDEKNMTWTQWLNSLTPDEASAVLINFKKIQIKAGQRIFQQGECDSRLILIESGKLKLTYWDSLKKKHILFSEPGKGDICGAESFFSHSPHTGTLSAVEKSVIRCLYKNEFQKLLSLHPALEKKLTAYCENHQKKIVFHESHNFARRAHQRFPASLKGQIQLIDSGGEKPSRALSVVISNISIGGVCCLAKNLAAGQAAGFYQNQVKLKIFYQYNSLPCVMEKSAKAIAVRFLPSGESTIHLQFQVLLTEKEIFKMVRQDNIYTYS